VDGVELFVELELDDEPQPATISAAPTRTASQEASRMDLIGMRENLLEGWEPERAHRICKCALVAC
jgi:hypothetical protein